MKTDKLQTQRVAALSKLLQIEPDEIHASEWRDCLFEISPHMTKSGDSPSQIREKVELTKKALRLVIGDAVDTLTTGELSKFYLEYKHLKTRIEETLIEARKECEELPHPVQDALQAGNFWKEPKPLTMGRTLLAFIPDRGETGISRRLKLEHALTKGSWATWPVILVEKFIEAYVWTDKQDRRANYKNRATQISQMLLKYEEIQAHLKNIHAYNTLVAKLSDNTEASEMLKIGIHDVVNTLYFVCPDSLEYNAGRSDDHRLSVIEAWDGKEVIDRRKPYQTNNGEYLVLTNHEADKEREEILDCLLDDPGVVEGSNSKYFDRKAWKRDARQDGRGHIIAGYDSEERVVTLDGPDPLTFHVYRIN